MSYGNYPDLTKIKKILIIKHRQLGDVLLTTPLISSLKKYLKDVQIDLYINQNAKNIFDDNSDVSEIITLDRSIKKKGFFKKLIYEWKILRKIKKNKYDLVINLTEGDRGALATKVSNAKYKIGIESNKKKHIKNKFYTNMIKLSNVSRHHVERNLDALRLLGINPTDEDKKLCFNIADKTFLSLKEKLSSKNFQFNEYILIHPSSFWRFKCYPILKLKKIVDLLIENGEKIIFSSGDFGYEKEMIQTLIHNLPENKYIDLSAKTTLNELAALIKKSKLLICMDSLPLHISSVYKSNVIVFFGPTSEKNWGPWMNDNATLVVNDSYICRPCFIDGCGGSKISDCLHSIDEDHVFSICKKKLDN